MSKKYRGTIIVSKIKMQVHCVGSNSLMFHKKRGGLKIVTWTSTESCLY